jgi:hypothetical protein
MRTAESGFKLGIVARFILLIALIVAVTIAIVGADHDEPGPATQTSPVHALSNTAPRPHADLN